jgi:hypothetical protein
MTAPAWSAFLWLSHRSPTAGLVLLPDAFTWAIRRQVVALAASYRLPAIYQRNAAIAHSRLCAGCVQVFGRRQR